jgi:hypothetical protein
VATATRDHFHTPGQAREERTTSTGEGSKGGRPPWESDAQTRGNGRPREPPNPGQAGEERTTGTGGGPKGVVPPGHQKNAGSRRPEAGSPEPGTWQLPTRAPPHPRPSTRSPRHQHRRGVEGGSSPLGITGGGSKGGRPPWASTQNAEGRTPRNVATANASTITPRPSTRSPRHQHRRGVEGGSSPLGITGGGSKGGRPPWASEERRKQEARSRKPGTRNVATADAGTSTPPAKHDYRTTSTGGGSKGGRPPWGSPAGGRRGVVPPGSSRPPWASEERRKQEARSRKPGTRNVATADAGTSTPPAKHDYRTTSTGGGSKGGRPPWE